MPEEIIAHVVADHFALLERPRLAAHIAVVTSIWSEIEDEISWMFAMGMQTELAVASAILGEVFSLALKLKLTRRALGFRFSADELKPFGKLSQHLREGAAGRNGVVHAMWTVDRKHPSALIRLSGISDPKLKMEKYVLRDFLEIERRLIDLLGETRKFVQSLAACLTPTTEEQQRELFWHLTEHPPRKAERGRRKRQAESQESAPSKAPRSKHLRPLSS